MDPSSPPPTEPDTSGARPLAVAPVHPQRLVYLGTPQMAVAPLHALHAAGHAIALVVSRADTRRGRGGAMTPSPVKAAALELGLEVSDRIADVLDVGADLGVVVAYGRIIARPVLEHVPMVNLHFSLLPRWRGAAPVERAILAGDHRTGVDLMVVEEGLDTGAIYAEVEVPIGPDTTAEELRVALVDAGAALLVDTLATGLGAPRPQVGESLYADKLSTAELEIDWAQPAEIIHRLVRVGGAWTIFRGKRFKVWRSAIDPAAASVSVTDPPGVAADGSDGPPGLPGLPGTLDGTRVATGGGWLTLVEVQPEGKARQGAAAWRNGARPDPDERLGA